MFGDFSLQRLLFNFYYHSHLSWVPPRRIYARFEEELEDPLKPYAALSLPPSKKGWLVFWDDSYLRKASSRSEYLVDYCDVHADPVGFHEDGAPLFKAACFRDPGRFLPAPVGSILFYGLPGPCRLGDRDNILELGGVLSNLKFAPLICHGYDMADSVSDSRVCKTLPPTPSEHRSAQVSYALQHGIIRGISRIAGHVAEQAGCSVEGAHRWQDALFYGGSFGWSLYENCRRHPELGLEWAILQTGAHTLGLVCTNKLLLDPISGVLHWLGQKANAAGRTTMGPALSVITKGVGYGTYAYHAYATGIKDAATRMLVGGAVEKAVQTVGNFGVDMLFAYRANRQTPEVPVQADVPAQTQQPNENAIGIEPETTMMWMFQKLHTFLLPEATVAKTTASARVDFAPGR